MFAILLKLLNVLVVLTVGLFLYHFFGMLKYVSFQTDEGLLPEFASKKPIQINSLRAYMRFTFVIVGTLVWIMLGISAGSFAAHFGLIGIAQWLIFVACYFLLLRFPFGILNRMIQSDLEAKKFPEFIVFWATFMSMYAMAIYYYGQLPRFLTWYLYWM